MANFNKDFKVPVKVDAWGHTTYKEYKLSYRWTIDKFSEKISKTGYKMLESPLFSSEGQSEKWRLKLYPDEQRSIKIYWYVNLIESNQEKYGIWTNFLVTLASSKAEKTISYEQNGVKCSRSSGCGGHFTDKSSLIDTSNGYLVNDTLTIYCQLTVKLFGVPVNTSGRNPKPAPTNGGALSKLNSARLTGQYTDVVLVAEDKEYKAHRVILATQSSFFNTRFQQRWDQGANRVQMSDITAATLESILQFVYTGECEIDETNAPVLLAAAQEYGIDSLKSACEEKIEVTCENVIQTLALADTHDASYLKEICIDFFAANSSTLLSSHEWRELENSGHHDKLVMQVLRETLRRKN